MEAARDLDMSDDYIILNQIMEEYDLTVKWLKAAIGRHQTTVTRYLVGAENGGLPIPTIVWRVLYARTQDRRIIQLIVGELPIAVVPIVPDDNIYAKLEAPSFKKLHSMRRKQLAVEEDILDILEDGKIDGKDAAAVGRYQRNFDESIATQIEIKERILTTFNKSKKRSQL